MTSDKFMILGGYQMFSILATESASSAGWISMVVWLVILFAFMYFFMVRPQKKEQQKKNSMLAELAVGDTMSGFYGTVIDIADDTVIVEFGSNKNCRIPMQKAAISAVEKPEDVTE